MFRAMPEFQAHIPVGNADKGGTRLPPPLPPLESNGRFFL
jgi:hypothetical protein